MSVSFYKQKNFLNVRLFVYFVWSSRCFDQFVANLPEITYISCKLDWYKKNMGYRYIMDADISLQIWDFSVWIQWRVYLCNKYSFVINVKLFSNYDEIKVWFLAHAIWSKFISKRERERERERERDLIFLLTLSYQ